MPPQTKSESTNLSSCWHSLFLSSCPSSSNPITSYLGREFHLSPDDDEDNDVIILMSTSPMRCACMSRCRRRRQMKILSCRWHGIISAQSPSPLALPTFMIMVHYWLLLIGSTITRKMPMLEICTLITCLSAGASSSSSSWLWASPHYPPRESGGERIPSSSSSSNGDFGVRSDYRTRAPNCTVSVGRAGGYARYCVSCLRVIISRNLRYSEANKRGASHDLQRYFSNIAL